MNTFYTSVELKGDNILVRGYKDGNRFKEKVHFQPSLYFPTNNESEYHSDDGTPLMRKKYASIKEMKDSLKTFEGVSNHKYYGTTNVIRQFISENYSGEIKWENGIAQIWFWDIETTVGEAVLLPPDDEVYLRDKKGVISSHTELGLNALTINSSYEIYEDEQWKQLSDSKYRVKGFPTANNAYEEIQLVTFYNITTNKGYVFSSKPIREDNPILANGADFQSFENERDLLRAIIMFMQSNWIDILAGWNSELFDVPYLTNRIKRVLGEKVSELLSPWKILQKRNFTVNEKEYETYEWLGICLLDYLDIYKKFNPGSQESFKLDHIAEIEIGANKVENPYESFVEFYQNDWDLFVEYNFRDATLLRDIEEKMQMMPLALMMAFDAKINIGDVTSAQRSWESTIYNYFRDMNQFQQANAPKKQARKIPGAYVHPPVIGKHRWLTSLDFTALYPSCIMQNNISPETKFKKLDIGPEDILAGNIPEFPSGYTLSGNGVLCSKEKEGFIPFLIRQKFDLRKKFKKEMLKLDTEAQLIRDELKHVTDVEKIKNLKEVLIPLESKVKMLDVKQKAMKTQANSFYGILLLTHFQHYDPDLGEAITLTGQVALRTAMKLVNDFLNKSLKTENVVYVVAGDTDSSYICLDRLVDKCCVGKSDAEIVNFIEKFVGQVLQPMINKGLQSLFNKLGVTESRLDQKLECIGPSAAFVAKKRYAFDILYSEGVRYEYPKMKVVGMEIVRSSTPSLIKDKLKQAVKTILAKEEIDLQKYVKEVKDTFMSLDYHDIAFPRGCNGLLTYSSNSGIYEKGCPIHVRGALLYNHYVKKLNLESKYPLIGEGEKIKFIALKMPNPIHENVIAFITNIPEEFGLLKYIDYDTQYEKAFLAPIQGVLDAVKWTPEEQVNLEDFC